jgi:hypothetical protein
MPLAGPCTYCTCTPAPPVLSTSSQKACALYVARTQYAARAHQLVARSNSKAQGVGSGCTACSHCRCCCCSCSCSCSCSRCSHCRNAVAVTQGAFRFHAPNPQPHPRPSTFLLALLLALALTLALGFVAFPWGLGNGSPYILICTTTSQLDLFWPANFRPIPQKDSAWDAYTAKETENRQGEVGFLRYSPYGP